MTQGERVKEVRKALGLTLDKFGEKVGVKKQTVSRIENGVNNVTDQMVLSICREFNVNYDFLMNGEGEMFDDLPQTVLDELCVQYDLDDLDRNLVEMYLEMPEQVRPSIYTVTEFLKPGSFRMAAGRWYHLHRWRRDLCFEASNL